MSFQGLHDTVRNNWWGIQNVGAAFAAVGGAIAVGAGAAVKAAAGFESGMVGIARTTRTGTESAAQATENVGALGEELRSLALIRPVGLESIQRIAEEAGALGVKREDVRGFTQTIVDLISATNLTEQSATQLARIGGVMSIPASEFANLGSAIMEAGRSTASTETEIVNFATRLASSARTANLTAGELVALSAATLSLGSRAEAGASAMQRTLGNMGQAIASGGQDLEAFAKVAGVNVEEFSRIFRTSGYDALTLYVEGLNSMGRDTIKVTSALNAAGITEVRQVKALQELAAGVKSTVNPMLDLRNAQQGINAAYTDGNALTEAAGEVNKTATARFAMAKNAVKDLGIAFGSILLPVIKPVADAVANLSTGIAQLPLPLRVIMTVITTAVAAFTALGAAVLLIGPRLILVKGAFQALRDGVLGAAQAEGIEAKAADTAAAANTRLAGAKNAVTGAAAASTRAVGGLAVAEGAEARAADLNAVSTGRMTQADFLAAQAKGRLAGASAAAIPGLAGYQGAVDRSTVAAVRMTQADYLAAQAKGRVAGASLMAIPGLNGYAGAATGAAAASGAAASAAGGAAASSGLASRALGGLGKAAKFVKSPIGLATLAMVGLTGWTIKQGSEARKAAEANSAGDNTLKDLSSAMADAEAGTEGLTDAQEAGAEAAQKLSEAIREQNQGLQDLYTTQMEARGAQQELKEAERELAEARANAADNSEDIAAAEAKVVQSRLDAQEALENVAAAEERLGTARIRQQEELRDAEDDLIDAQDKYRDSTEKVIEAQQALSDLQAGPSVNDLRDATNKLTEAQLKLRSANQKVTDSQWYLNYLMEEGASARDIQDAQFALAEANHEVQESIDSVADAQEEYNDITTTTPEERAEAERDLAKAIRDSDKALRDISEAEREVADLRQDIANDTAYREAEAALARARMDVLRSNRDVATSEQELRAARAGTDDIDALAQAELGYERALYGVARAQADAEIASRRARGEHIGAAEEAAILARRLRDVGASAEGPAAAGMRRYADALGSMRDEVDQAVADSNDKLAMLGDIPAPDLSFLDALNEQAEAGGKEAGEKTGKGLMDSLKTYIKENFVELLIGAIVFAVAAFLLPAGALFVVAAAIISGIAAYLYTLLPETWQKAIENWIFGIPGWIGDKLTAIKDATKEQWISWAIASVFGVPGAIFKALWDGLKVGEWLRGIFNRDKGTSDQGGKEAGRSAGDWLREGFVTYLRSFFTPGSWLRTIFSNSRSTTGQEGFSWGTFLGDMLRRGMLGSLGGLGGALMLAITGALGGLPTWIKSPINAAIGAYNSFIESMARASYTIDPVKVLGKTVFPGMSMGFGFMRNLKIPYLASGGIVNSPTVAMIGESGPEAVIPLDKLFSAFASIDTLALQLASTNQALMDLAALTAGTVNNGGDTFNLTAVTDADPTEIVGEFMWAKRVQSR